jgi:hypothetical protein
MYSIPHLMLILFVHLFDDEYAGGWIWTQKTIFGATTNIQGEW